MLSEIEVSEVEELISVIKQSNATTKNASSSSENYEVTEQIDQSNELVPSPDLKLAAEDETLTSEVKAVDKPRTVEEIENTPPKLSGGFHWSDVNKNGWISPDEVLHFIDLLFEGESLRNVEDIQSLIDYYFDQE
jgi:hypothetical protein